MSRYLLEFSYTSDAWSALARTPADRSQGIEKLCQAYGGHMVDLYYSFSDVDGVLLIDVPNHAAASGVAVTALAQGHIKSYRIIPLLTPRETVEIMRTSGRISYPAPGSAGAITTGSA